MRYGGTAVWGGVSAVEEEREERAYACFLLRPGRRGYMGLVMSVVTSWDVVCGPEPCC